MGTTFVLPLKGLQPCMPGYLPGPGEVLLGLVSLLVVLPCPQSMLLALVLLLVISKELGEVGFCGRKEVLQVEAAEKVDNLLAQRQEA